MSRISGSNRVGEDRPARGGKDERCFAPTLQVAFTPSGPAPPDHVSGRLSPSPGGSGDVGCVHQCATGPDPGVFPGGPPGPERGPHRRRLGVPDRLRPGRVARPRPIRMALHAGPVQRPDAGLIRTRRCVRRGSNTRAWPPFGDQRCSRVSLVGPRPPRAGTPRPLPPSSAPDRRALRPGRFEPRPGPRGLGRPGALRLERRSVPARNAPLIQSICGNTP